MSFRLRQVEGWWWVLKWGARRRLFPEGLRSSALLVIATRMCAAGLFPSLLLSSLEVGWYCRSPPYRPTDCISKEFCSPFYGARKFLLVFKGLPPLALGKGVIKAISNALNSLKRPDFEVWVALVTQETGLLTWEGMGLKIFSECLFLKWSLGVKLPDSAESPEHEGVGVLL